MKKMKKLKSEESVEGLMKESSSEKEDHLTPGKERARRHWRRMYL